MSQFYQAQRQFPRQIIGQAPYMQPVCTPMQFPQSRILPQNFQATCPYPSQIVQAQPQAQYFQPPLMQNSLPQQHMIQPQNLSYRASPCIQQPLNIQHQQLQMTPQPKIALSGIMAAQQMPSSMLVAQQKLNKPKQHKEKQLRQGKEGKPINLMQQYPNQQQNINFPQQNYQHIPYAHISLANQPPVHIQQQMNAQPIIAPNIKDEKQHKQKEMHPAQKPNIINNQVQQPIQHVQGIQQAAATEKQKPIVQQQPVIAQSMPIKPKIVQNPEDQQAMKDQNANQDQKDKK